LDCYRLAQHYHQNPELFLNMAWKDVVLHMRRTAELSRLNRQQASDA